MATAIQKYYAIVRKRGYTHRQIGWGIYTNDTPGWGIHANDTGRTIKLIRLDMNAGILHFRDSAYSHDESVRSDKLLFNYSLQTPLEQELQGIVDLMCKTEGFERVSLGINNRSQRSYADCNRWHIKIGHDLLDEGLEYLWAVAIHEVCHFLAWKDGGRNHDSIFRQIEVKWLREFGLRATYMRAYWKHLATLDGMVIWSNWRYRDKQSLRAASDYFRKGN